MLPVLLHKKPISFSFFPQTLFQPAFPQTSLKFIQQLPEKERKTLYLRYFHGMTQEAASRVLGVSQVQVSRLERRAVERLREVLTDT